MLASHQVFVCKYVQWNMFEICNIHKWLLVSKKWRNLRVFSLLLRHVLTCAPTALTSFVYLLVWTADWLNKTLIWVTASCFRHVISTSRDRSRQANWHHLSWPLHLLQNLSVGGGFQNSRCLIHNITRKVLPISAMASCSMGPLGVVYWMNPQVEFSSVS